MLGHTTIETLNRDIEQLTENIAQLEQQLAIAREERKQKEAERQAVQTFVAAGNSSLEQAENFLSLTTRADRFDLVASFWEEMDKLRERFSRQAIADLPPAPEPELIEEEPTEPAPDGDGDGDAVEVESEELTDAPDDSDAPEKVAESRQPQSVGAAVLDLDQMSKKDIERECLDTKGLSKAQVKEYGPLTRKSTWIAAYRAN
ncbi:MAG: hypothetical protein J7647_32770 [Cyanobacteria bacterium SBLK]|nr:hypothetical protein [Cyanobacteria bacterium SBLK]